MAANATRVASTAASTPQTSGPIANDLIDETLERVGVAFIRLGGELEERIVVRGGLSARDALLGEPARDTALGSYRRMAGHAPSRYVVLAGAPSMAAVRTSSMWSTAR